MTTQELLAELEPLTHEARVHMMHALGKRARTEPSIVATIATMEQGDFYERYFALQSCTMSRDTRHILRAFSDPSQLIRNLAVSLIAIIGTDEDVVTALQRSSRKTQRRLLKALQVRKRQEPINAFLSSNLSSQSLAFGSLDVTMNHLDNAVREFDAVDWKTFATYHPDAAVIELGHVVQTPPTVTSWWNCPTAKAIEQLCITRPSDMINLLPAMERSQYFANHILELLIKRHPVEAIEFALTSTIKYKFIWYKVALLLKPKQIINLTVKEPDWGINMLEVGLLRRFSPSQRQAYYKACGKTTRVDFQESLQRMMAVVPVMPTSVPGCLPLSQQTDKIDDLAKILQNVISQAKNPSYLEFRNTDDLLTIPSSRWNNSHKVALEQIVELALTAQSVQSRTFQAIEYCLEQMMFQDPKWSAEWISKLFAKTGTLKHGSGHIQLPAHKFARIVPNLLSIFEPNKTLLWEAALVDIAERLASHITNFDSLVNQLESILATTTDYTIAERVLVIFKRYAPSRLEWLMPALIDRVPLWARNATVLNFLQYRRQDLLNDALAPMAEASIYSTLPIHDFFRWTPKQQTIFADELFANVRSKPVTPEIAKRVTKLIAMLPSIVPTQLIALTDTSNQAEVREAAIEALGDLDGGQGIDSLIRKLDTEYSEIAALTLRRAMRALPPERIQSVWDKLSPPQVAQMKLLDDTNKN